MPTVITAFDVSVDGVDPAIRAVAADGRRIYRGISGSAAFGLIALSRHATVDDAVKLAFADDAGPVPAFSGVYTEHDIGRQSADPIVDDEDVITFINCLSVEPGREAVAYSRWKRVNDYMVAKPGYLAHTLYRRACTRARFAFVNVVRWQSAESLRTAQDERFRQLTRDLPFLPHPSLCRPVDVLVPAGTS